MKPAESNQKLQCSFCQRNEKEVEKIITGPQGNICNECVKKYVDILNEEGTKSIVPSK